MQRLGVLYLAGDPLEFVEWRAREVAAGYRALWLMTAGARFGLKITSSYPTASISTTGGIINITSKWVEEDHDATGE